MITEKQKEVYTFLIDRLITTSRIPTLSEIASSLKMDKRSAFQFLSSLEKNALIRKVDGKIEIIGEEKDLIINKRIENREGGVSYVSLPKDEDPSLYFSSIIASDEMKNIGLLPGDEGIFKRDQELKTGSIVLCKVGEENHLMLRRLLIRSDGLFELIPENDSMGKTVAASLIIEGVLVKSRRRYA